MVILAAGALPWRRRRGTLQVALVHRPRYDDWSWAKGKLELNEEWPVAAVREVLEETGFRVHLGRPLPTSEYPVAGQSGPPTDKVCRYWAAEVVGGDGALVNEIDEVVWLDVTEAADRLSYPRDRDQLEALVAADESGTLTTWPLVIIRHAKSRSRSKWTHPDALRPLNASGRIRAEALVPILSAYGITRVVTSPSVRCLDTVLPYAVAAGHPARQKEGLSEEGFAAQPDRARHHLTQVLERGNAAVICSHGPVLPALLDQLAELAGPVRWANPVDPGNPVLPDVPVDAGDPDAGSDPATLENTGTMGELGEKAARLVLSEAAERGMGKGEALVVHLVGTGDLARVVDVEHYHAP